jgi:hypothetical protein
MRCLNVHKPPHSWKPAETSDDEQDDVKIPSVEPYAPLVPTGKILVSIAAQPSPVNAELLSEGSRHSSTHRCDLAKPE